MEGCEMRRKGQWWWCNVCDAQNHETDGECQFCECEGMECKRENCADPAHFHADHLTDGVSHPKCYVCAALAQEGGA